jgi:hypothetical protein
MTSGKEIHPQLFVFFHALVLLPILLKANLKDNQRVFKVRCLDWIVLNWLAPCYRNHNCYKL